MSSSDFKKTNLDTFNYNKKHCCYHLRHIIRQVRHYQSQTTVGVYKVATGTTVIQVLLVDGNMAMSI